tara:strand:- start:62 stop:433 length:372 start_codon:yes stop_codon:yes gene_type:complete
MENTNNYYSDGNISNGLRETKHALKNILKDYADVYVNKEIYSDYYKELFNCIDKAIKLIDNKKINNEGIEKYILILWPEVQEYMEEEWFNKEAILYQAIRDEQEHLDSAYFIPEKYMGSARRK